jgi:hypothetical protein
MEMKMLKIVIVLLILLTPLNQQIFCNEDSSTLLWNFQFYKDRYVHVEAVVSLKKSTASYKFLEVPEEIWIKNIEIRTESGDSISYEVTYNNRTKTQIITLMFSQPLTDSTLNIELDLMDSIRKKDEVFFFEWWYTSEEEESHTAVVTLPQGEELLELKYITPEKVEEGDKVTVFYKGKSGPKDDFRFQIAFSSAGRYYIGLGEKYQEEERYDPAIFYYRRAKSIYGQFNLYRPDGAALLAELQNRIFAMQKILADSTFEEGLTALDQKDFETAKPLFEKAENLYNILKDTERESKCREMINECERLKGLKEADKVLEQGREQYRNFNYLEAEKPLSRPRICLKNWEMQRRCPNVRNGCTSVTMFTRL